MQSPTPPGTVLSTAAGPAERRSGDTVEVRTVIDGAGYAEPLVHRRLTAGRGRSLPRREDGADELLFVTSGAGLLLLGVFRPAGSAAAAYYPDGRPAPHDADE